MLKKKFALLIFIILIIISTSTLAYNEDFYAFSPYETINICQCATSSIPLTIENTGTAQEQITITMDHENADSEINTEFAIQTSVYTVTQKGEASQWSTVFPNKFSAEQGESKTVESVITAPCNKEGEYELTTKIATDLGKTKEFTQKVIVNNCDTIDIIPLNTITDGCPCEPKNYEVIIKNTGSYNDKYYIDISENVRDYFTLSENPVSINAGEEETVFLYFNGPCGFYGEYNFDMIVVSDKNRNRETQELVLDIGQCYDFALETGEIIHTYDNSTDFIPTISGYDICEKEKAVLIPIRITNTADITNTYNLELESEKWAKLDYNKISDLKKNEYRTINIILNPYSYLEGDYNFTLEVETGIGDISKEYNIPVSVEWCYTPEISKEIEKIRVNYSTLATELTIENLGVKNASYNLSIDLGWAEIRPSNISVLPYESKIIDLVTFPNNMTEEGKYDAVIRAESTDNHVIYEKTVQIKLSDNKDDGFFRKILIGLLILILLIIILLLFVLKSRKGKEEAEEEKEIKHIEAPEKKEKNKKEKEKKEKTGIWKWLIILLALIIILALLFYGALKTVDYFASGNETIVNDTITNITDVQEQTQVEPEKQVPPEVPSNLSEDLNASDDSSEQGAISSLKNMSSKTGEYIKKAGSSIWGFLKTYRLYIIVGLILAIILIILLSFFGRDKTREEKEVKKEKKIEEKKKEKPVYTEKKARVKAKKAKKTFSEVKNKDEGGKGIWWILGLLLLIILLAGAGYWYINSGALDKAYGNETNATTEQEVIQETEQKIFNFTGVDCVLEWPKNTQKELDLNKIFYDPDGDRLNFSSTNPENMTITIKDNIAVLEPKKDFVGVIKAGFVGYDSDGYNVTTDLMSFCVKDEEVPWDETVTQTFYDYKILIISILLLIALLVIVGLLFGPIMKFLEEEEGTSAKNENKSKAAKTSKKAKKKTKKSKKK